MDAWGQFCESQKRRETCSDPFQPQQPWKKSSSSGSVIGLWRSEGKARDMEGVIRPGEKPHTGERASAMIADALGLLLRDVTIELPSNVHFLRT